MPAWMGLILYLINSLGWALLGYAVARLAHPDL